MDEKTFKKIHKPAACTQPVWQVLISSDKKHEVLAKIRQESIAAYGQSYDECPKRKTCFTQTCMGRPLPLKSQTAKPYIEQLKKTHKVNANGELLLSNCDSCTIKQSCKSLCSQVNDFLNRDKVEEPEINYKENLDNIVPENLNSALEKIMGKGFQIPFDCLTIKRQDTIKKYLYEQKDFLTIAKEMGYYDQAQAKYEFYAALTKLSKFGVMRKMCYEKFNTGEIDHRDQAILNDIFFINKSLTEASYTWKLSKQALNKLIKKYKNKFNLRWQIFVRKQGNKVVYNVPEIFK